MCFKNLIGWTDTLGLTKVMNEDMNTESFGRKWHVVNQYGHHRSSGIMVIDVAASLKASKERCPRTQIRSMKPLVSEYPSTHRLDNKSQM